MEDKSQTDDGRPFPIDQKTFSNYQRRKKELQGTGVQPSIFRKEIHDAQGNVTGYEDAVEDVVSGKKPISSNNT